MRKLLDGLNVSDYADIILIIDKLEEAVTVINTAIDEQDTVGLVKGYDLGQEAYLIFYS